METNATAVVAVAEHFVRQHSGIGPILESEASFLDRLMKISAFFEDRGADEAIRSVSSRLLPEILISSTSQNYEKMMNFSRESVLKLSGYLKAPVNDSNSLMAFYVGKVSTTNLTVALGSVSVSYKGEEDNDALFRKLPRDHVSYLDEKLVSDIVDVWTGAEGVAKPTLDLIFEMNPRFRRAKHLPRCAQFPPSDPSNCMTLEISNNVICSCEGRGTFGVVLREHSQIAENFLGIEMMVRDSKWILSESFDSLIEVQESFARALRKWRGPASSKRGDRRRESRTESPNSVLESLYDELLPVSLARAESVANFSAILDFFRHASHALLESDELRQKYLRQDITTADASPTKPSIMLSSLDGGLQFMRNIPVAEIERFELNNDSVTLSTNLQEIIALTPAIQEIIANFTGFERIRHGDVKCVRFDTKKGYFDATGCNIQNRTETDLVCACDQPGAVGVIVVPFESCHALNIFSASAIAINILCLSVCVILLYYVPDDYSLRSMFRFHQSCALLLGQAVLIASTITVRSAPVFEPCNALVGFLLQFSFLVAVVFVGFEATEALKQTFLMSLSPAISGKKRFIVLGYGIPLLFATVSFGFNAVYIGSYQLCLADQRQHLLWISAIPFMVVVGLCLTAAVAAFVRLACLSKDQSERHGTKLRSYSVSTTLLAMIITLQWGPGHLIQIEGTGLIMAFLFFFATLLQGPIMVLLFVKYERDDRKAMALGLARDEGKITRILADLVRPPVVGEKVGDDEPRTRSLREPLPRVDSNSISRIAPLELRQLSEPPVV